MAANKNRRWGGNKRNLKLLKTNVYHMRHKISMPLYIWWKNNCYEIFIWKVIKLCNWKAHPSQHEIIMQLGNEHILCPLVLILIYATSLPQYFGCLDISLFFFSTLYFFFLFDMKRSLDLFLTSILQSKESDLPSPYVPSHRPVPVSLNYLLRRAGDSPSPSAESHLSLCSRKKLLSSKLLKNLLTSTTYHVSPKG